MALIEIFDSRSSFSVYLYRLGRSETMAVRLQGSKLLKVEVAILDYLWNHGATSLPQLALRLYLPSAETKVGATNLIEKGFIYKIYEPLDDEGRAIYYLTSETRDRLDAAFKDNPGYRMEKLWYALQREGTKLRRPRSPLSS